MGHSRRKEKSIRSYSMAYVKGLYFNRSYNLLTNNCVQVSMRVLLQGTFASNNTNKVNMLRYLLNNGYMIPNDIYNYLNKNGFFK